MDNKDIMKQLQENKAALLQLMNSPEGKRLVQIVNQQAGGRNLRQAAGAAAKGDTTGITQILEDLVHTPEGSQALERIRQSIEQ